MLEDDKSHQEGGLGWDKVEGRCCYFCNYGDKHENAKRDQSMQEIVEESFLSFGE